MNADPVTRMDLWLIGGLICLSLMTLTFIVQSGLHRIAKILKACLETGENKGIEP